MQRDLEVLSVNLDKKIDVLNKIIKYNEMQERLFTDDTTDIDSFNDSINQKGELIDELVALDEKFEEMYAILCSKLGDNRESYAEEINIIKSKLRSITELSDSVRAGEARNKILFEEFISQERAKIARGRRGTKVAYDYYKSMSGGDYGSNVFMDQKN